MSIPLYAQIQTYTTCTPDTLASVLTRYWETLNQLGCHDIHVHEWLQAISWPQTDDDAFGDIYAAPLILAPPTASLVTCAGIEASLYTFPGIPTLDEPPSWLSLNLLLDPSRLRPDSTDVYKKHTGQALWLILREMAATFPEIGAYFTDPWQENQAWRAIVENTGDPWAFELAIFPRKLSGHFKEVPPGYQGTVLDGSFGFAPGNRWEVLPWQAAQ